jgi:hypothetical protein
MISLDLVIRNLQNSCKPKEGISRTVFERFPDHIRVAFQTTAIGAVTYLADKVKKALPDNNRATRTQFAEKVTADLQEITGTFKTITDDTSPSHNNWRDPDFISLYQTKLSKSPLHQHTKNKHDFYEKLAIRLLARIEKELPPAMEPHIGAILKDLERTFDRDVTKEKLKQFLLQIDELLTDRTQIKEWLTQLLKTCNTSMEPSYDEFLKKVTSASWWIPFSSLWNNSSQSTTKKESTPEQTPDSNTEHSNNYGKVIMDFIMMLEPHTLGRNTLSTYKFLVGADSIGKGTDFFSVLLKNATGAGIEQLMSSNTDSWVQEAFKLARANLFEENASFIQRPLYISDKEWTDLSPLQKQEACTKGTDTYQKYKSRHIQKVDRELIDTAQRLGRNIFRAGLILEQFLPKMGNVVLGNNTEKNTSHNWFVRSLALTWILFREAPIIQLIFNCIHRLSIAIRDIISNKAAKSTAENLSQNIDKFLETDSIEVLVRTMLEKMLDNLELLDDPQKTAKAAGTGLDEPAGVGLEPAGVGLVAVPATEPDKHV